MLKSDLHVHTIKSEHAFNTIDECITKAAEIGLSYIGIADHAPSMKGAPHLEYFQILSRLPKQDKGVTILYGCEANILSTDGDIDLTRDVCSRLNYVSAGLHNLTPYSGLGVKDNTKAIINAIKNGDVDIITHPYRKEFPVDIRETVLCAKEHGVILELNKFVLLSAITENNKNLSKNLNKMIDFIAEAKSKCIFGSDAHHISEIGVSEREWVLLCDNYNISNTVLCNNDIVFLENMRHASGVM